MKKKAWLSLLLVAPMVLGVTSCSKEDIATETTSIVEEQAEEFIYSLAKDGSYYTIQKAESEYDNNLVIPSTYKNLPVTGIEADAFLDCGDLVTLTIPDSITYIGEQAFKGCNNLTKVTIGNGVKKISDRAFLDCGNLNEVELGNSIETIGKQAFASNTSLKSITLPNSLKTLGAKAFYNCTSLTDLDLGSGVEVIGASAFASSGKISCITIPASVKEIAENAFYDCSLLTEVYNLSSLDITMGSTDFGYVAYYALILHNSLEDSSCMVKDKNGFVFLYDGDKSYLVNYTGASAIVHLPESFIVNGSTISEYEIKKTTFASSKNIISITIPESVKAIEEDTFKDCVRLVEIYNLSSLTLEKGQEDHGAVASHAVVIHDNLEVESIVEEYQGGLLVTYIDNQVYVLGYNGNETSVALPDSLVFNENTYDTYEIYDYAFYLRSDLEFVSMSNSITYIGDYAFYGACSIGDFLKAKSLKGIGEYAFAENKNLVFANLPDTLIEVGKGAFMNCSSLGRILLGKGLTSLEENVFMGCSKLVSAFYTGTDTYTNTLTTIDSTNQEYLDNVTWYYFTLDGKDETRDGNWWYYSEDGIPTIVVEDAVKLDN